MFQYTSECREGMAPLILNSGLYEKSSGQLHFVAIYHRSLLYFLNIRLDKPKSGLVDVKKRKNIFTPHETELLIPPWSSM